jgi:hypothetical protein
MIRFVELKVDNLNARPLHQLQTVLQTIVFAIDNTLYARLNDEFGALYAGRGGDVHRSAVAAVV